MKTTIFQLFATFGARTQQALCLPALLLALTAACDGSTDPNPVVSVTPGSMTIAVGSTVQLAAAVTGSSNSDPQVSWRSADPAVASVDANGLVTGLAGGTVSIIAESEGVEGAASIEVWQPVSIVSLSIDPTASQLVYRLSVAMSGPAAIEVDYETAGAMPLRVVSPDTATTVDILMTRLLADAAYNVTVTPLGPASLRGTPDTGTLATGSLPAGLVAFQFTATGQMTTPLNMLELRSAGWSGTAMIDNEGRIVWWWEGLGRTNGVTRRANGNFVFLDFMSPTRLVEVTPDGLEVNELIDQPGVADIIHHDVVATAQNTILFLTRDAQVIVNDTTWIGDRIGEWDPETGSVDIRWDMFDFYSVIDDRGARSGPADFGHGNSLAIGPRGNYVISFSFLNQAASVAADFQSVEWRLGGPGSDFTFNPGDEFFFEHSVTEPDDNRVLLFDNGAGRPGVASFSRAIEYQLDSTAGEAQPVFEFRLFPDEFSRMVSSARRLSNGNTVVLFGGDTMIPKKAFEVTAAATVVWSMEIDGASTINRANPFADIAGEVEIATP